MRPPGAGFPVALRVAWAVLEVGLGGGVAWLLVAMWRTRRAPGAPAPWRLAAALALGLAALLALGGALVLAFDGGAP
jgi:hypothetical protein